MKRFSIYFLVPTVLVLTAMVPEGYTQAVQIRLGTVVPRDSLWHQVLQQMAQDWQRISEGQVRVTIYPGGVQGDGVAMLRRMRLGQLQAVALSSAGLAQADDGVTALQIPMMLNSYEELDYVRHRMEPVLEDRLEAKGYIVLNWGDGGWVHFFTKTPARTPDDIRAMKLFTSAGDPDAERLYRDFGFNPVPMAPTDLVPNLQTGLIDAFDVPPLFALFEQSFTLANHMIDVKWAPLVGATLISKTAWDRIPAALRPQLMASARAAGERLREDIRQLGEQSIETMQGYGLQITHVEGELQDVWRREVEAAYQEIRGRLVPTELFDEAMRLRDEFRESRTR